MRERWVRHRRIGLWVSAWVTDPKTGRLLSLCHQRSRSYVIGFLDLLAVQMGVGALTITDILGNARSVATSAVNLSAMGALADANHGIVVGTGTTAITIADTVLESKINNGVAPGTLQYQAQAHLDPSTTGATRRFFTTREFTNGSGGTITVTNVGLYVRGSVVTWSFLAAADILAVAQAVPDAKTLTVQYTIGVTA